MHRATSAACGLAHWLVAAAIVAIGSMVAGAALARWSDVMGWSVNS